MSALELVIDAKGHGSLTLDGEPLDGVAAVHISATANEPTKVVLEVNVVEMFSFLAEGPDILIPSQAAETLVLLGWTPPIAAPPEHDQAG